MATPPAMRGAVLEGWPEGSPGAREYGGVYRAAGAHAGLPRFEGAEPGASARHMYRYKKGGADKWPKKNGGRRMGVEPCDAWRYVNWYDCLSKLSRPLPRILREI